MNLRVFLFIQDGGFRMVTSKLLIARHLSAILSFKKKFLNS